MSMWLELRGGEWRSGPVRMASGFWQRWKGLRPYPGSGLLISGAAVHARGMRAPITVAGLDQSGRVLGVESLRPGARCSMPGARWMLELPDGQEAPAPGLPLETYRLS